MMEESSPAIRLWRHEHGTVKVRQYGKGRLPVARTCHVQGAGSAMLKQASWMDLIAGLSLAGLLLPEAVAYSTIAGLPPQAGVLALFAGLLCYAAIGTSRFAIVSATSSSAAVLTVATVAMGGASLAVRLTMASALVVVSGLLA